MWFNSIEDAYSHIQKSLEGYAINGVARRDNLMLVNATHPDGTKISTMNWIQLHGNRVYLVSVMT